MDYGEILKSAVSNDEKECAFYEMIKKCKNKDEILEICKNLSSLWKGITIARMSKLFKGLVYKIDQSIALDVLNGLIEMESKKMVLLALYEQKINIMMSFGMYNEALNQIMIMIKEYKKYDDKSGLISMYTYESKAAYAMKNKERSKSSLVSARALSVNTYCSSELQAEIDLMTGVHMCDDRKYDTASSYFLEALDGFAIKKLPEVIFPVRYVILSKIMSNKLENINVLLENKNIKPYLTDPICQQLLKIRDSCMNRDLISYDKILKENENLFLNDEFLRDHLHSLYNMLLNSNIQKIIESYKNIPISYISSQLGFENGFIEKRLRIMILDGEINGIINHSTQSLVLDEPRKDEECKKKCLEMAKMLYEHIKSQ